jgi:hypothetical protein
MRAPPLVYAREHECRSRLAHRRRSRKSPRAQAPASSRRRNRTSALQSAQFETPDAWLLILVVERKRGEERSGAFPRSDQRRVLPDALCSADGQLRGRGGGVASGSIVSWRREVEVPAAIVTESPLAAPHLSAERSLRPPRLRPHPAPAAPGQRISSSCRPRASSWLITPYRADWSGSKPASSVS